MSPLISVSILGLTHEAIRALEAHRDIDFTAVDMAHSLLATVGANLTTGEKIATLTHDYDEAKVTGYAAEQVEAIEDERAADIAYATRLVAQAALLAADLLAQVTPAEAVRVAQSTERLRAAEMALLVAGGAA